MAPHAVETARNEVNCYITNHQHHNPHTSPNDILNHNRSHLRSSMHHNTYDLICVGFGPANLAIAIALHDALDARTPLPGLTHIRHHPPRVLFLERQPRFAWHEGMLLPGTKMQITFVKDLATLRDPRSQFTFLNYLHERGRLVQFANLGTFLPLRVEYEHYMRWCAGWFEEVVEYSKEVVEVRPGHAGKGGVLGSFEVDVKDLVGGGTEVLKSRHVVVAVGGRPQIPASLPQDHPRVIHSAQYARQIDQILTNPFGAYNIAVVGAGQSAAEVFNDLQSRFPKARTRLIIRGGALRPSDDSPFVNEIFDPDRVDTFYEQPAEKREASLNEDKSTNYGVVRLELLEHIYSNLYAQRIECPEEEHWQHRILKYSTVVGCDSTSGSVTLRLQSTAPERTQGVKYEQHELRVDAVIVGSGYKRDTHEYMLEPLRSYQADDKRDQPFSVGRDYRVEFANDKVRSDAGIWLQGCNEGTHGLSDTLLSILATRGGEMVKSIFGDSATGLNGKV